ncbi:cyclin B1 interacting protein 1, E3 ubiquitin protein ligase [Coemansia spiralis]|nr:cyclin B1 interacting protein 1, E3 ubiquitin protein ligase [Coemansia spiralis]
MLTSQVLVGLPPWAVLDICHRALSFWSFQASFDMARQQQSMAMQAEKIRKVEERAAADIDSVNARLRQAEDIISITEAALDRERKSRAIAEDMLEDSHRNLQSLKAAYDQLCLQRVPPEMGGVLGIDNKAIW